MKSVTMRWAADNINKINLIDVRTLAEFENQNVKGSINIPLTKLVSNPRALLEKNKKYYIMCRSGKRSLDAYKSLDSKGYDVVQVEGGIISLDIE